MRKWSQGLLLAALVLVARLHLDEMDRRGVIEPPGPVPAARDAAASLAPRQADVALLGTYLRRQGIPYSQRNLPRLVERIHLAARRNDLDPSLVMAVIRTESTFRADAVSRKGAMGLMQLVPDTAEALAAELGVEWEGPHQLLEPDLNIELGSLYLRQLLDRYGGDLDLALEAYYRGPTRLARIRARGAEPRTYARRVQRRQDELR